MRGEFSLSELDGGADMMEFGLSGAIAGAAAVPIGIPPANLSEPLLGVDSELGSATGDFWIKKAGTFSWGLVSSASDATCLSCSASNNDVGTTAANLMEAGSSKFPAATGIPAVC
jgi:hypothetical protein